MIEIENRIKEIISSELDISSNEINENSGIEITENWDSVNALRIIISLENSFKVKFSIKKYQNLVTYKGILSEIIALSN